MSIINPEIKVMAKTRVSIVRIEGQVRWRTRRAKKGNWVAVCSPLKLTVQSDTWANLMEDIAYTLDAVLKDLLATNDFDKFMKEHGWKLIDSLPRRKENMRFDLPFYPVALNGSQRSLCQ